MRSFFFLLANPRIFDFSSGCHRRINFNPTHTCATCKGTAPNNYALERHASQKRHKAFLCNCTMEFVRLSTLNRHIAALAGPKHHCNYCDDNRSFAREDKLIDHLRASHKFGEKAIAQVRRQARSRSGVKGLASSTTTTPGTSLTVSTSAGHQAALDVTGAGLQDLSGYSTGPSADPIGIFHHGVVDHSGFNDAGLQPFSTAGHQPLAGASGDVAGFNVFGGGFHGDHFAHFDASVPGLSGAGFPGVDSSGVNFLGVNVAGVDLTDVEVDLEFADFDVDLDMSAMGTGI